MSKPKKDTMIKLPNGAFVRAELITSIIPRKPIDLPSVKRSASVSVSIAGGDGTSVNCESCEQALETAQEIFELRSTALTEQTHV